MSAMVISTPSTASEDEGEPQIASPVGGGQRSINGGRATRPSMTSATSRSEATASSAPMRTPFTSFQTSAEARTGTALLSHPLQDSADTRRSNTIDLPTPAVVRNIDFQPLSSPPPHRSAGGPVPPPSAPYSLEGVSTTPGRLGSPIFTGTPGSTRARRVITDEEKRVSGLKAKVESHSQQIEAQLSAMKTRIAAFPVEDLLLDRDAQLALLEWARRAESAHHRIKCLSRVVIESARAYQSQLAKGTFKWRSWHNQVQATSSLVASLSAELAAAEISREAAIIGANETRKIKAAALQAAEAGLVESRLKLNAARATLASLDPERARCKAIAGKQREKADRSEADAKAERELEATLDKLRSIMVQLRESHVAWGRTKEPYQLAMMRLTVLEKGSMRLIEPESGRGSPSMGSPSRGRGARGPLDLDADVIDREYGAGPTELLDGSDEPITRRKSTMTLQKDIESLRDALDEMDVERVILTETLQRLSRELTAECDRLGNAGTEGQLKAWLRDMPLELMLREIGMNMEAQLHMEFDGCGFGLELEAAIDKVTQLSGEMMMDIARKELESIRSTAMLATAQAVVDGIEKRRELLEQEIRMLESVTSLEQDVRNSFENTERLSEYMGTRFLEARAAFEGALKQAAEVRSGLRKEAALVDVPTLMLRETVETKWSELQEAANEFFTVRDAFWMRLAGAEPSQEQAHNAVSASGSGKPSAASRSSANVGSSLGSMSAVAPVRATHDLEQAAATIQATFRGHKVRRGDPTTKASDKAAKELKAASAKKIQGAWRKYHDRKKKDVAATTIQRKWRGLRRRGASPAATDVAKVSKHKGRTGGDVNGVDHTRDSAAAAAAAAAAASDKAATTAQTQGQVDKDRLKLDLKGVKAPSFTNRPPAPAGYSNIYKQNSRASESSRRSLHDGGALSPGGHLGRGNSGLSGMTSARTNDGRGIVEIGASGAASPFTQSLSARRPEPSAADRVAAATKIQATWRMFLQRRTFLRTKRLVTRLQALYKGKKQRAFYAIEKRRYDEEMRRKKIESLLAYNVKKGTLTTKGVVSSVAAERRATGPLRIPLKPSPAAPGTAIPLPPHLAPAPPIIKRTSLENPTGSGPLRPPETVVRTAPGTALLQHTASASGRSAAPASPSLWTEAGPGPRLAPTTSGPEASISRRGSASKFGGTNSPPPSTPKARPSRHSLAEASMALASEQAVIMAMHPAATASPPMPSAPGSAEPPRMGRLSATGMPGTSGTNLLKEELEVCYEIVKYCAIEASPYASASIHQTTNGPTIRNNDAQASKQLVIADKEKSRVLVKFLTRGCYANVLHPTDSAAARSKTPAVSRAKVLLNNLATTGPKMLFAISTDYSRLYWRLPSATTRSSSGALTLPGSSSKDFIRISDIETIQDLGVCTAVRAGKGGEQEELYVLMIRIKSGREYKFFFSEKRHSVAWFEGMQLLVTNIRWLASLKAVLELNLQFGEKGAK